MNKKTGHSKGPFYKMFILSAVACLSGFLAACNCIVGDNAFGVEGIEMSVAAVDALRSDAELTFRLSPGPEARFRGFWSCDTD